jgi:hypothetical protein
MLFTGVSHGHLIKPIDPDHRKPMIVMPRPFHLISSFFTRRVLARLLSTFLCCLTLVIKPWSQFGGPSAFLLLTLKELVFSAQDTLAQHLEATILNITGALFGIGLSTFARYVASLRPDYTASSRAIPAVFLFIIAFLGKWHSSVYRILTNGILAGWAKSRLPRLQLSARISCFVSIWFLTTNVGISSVRISQLYSHTCELNPKSSRAPYTPPPFLFGSHFRLH